MATHDRAGAPAPDAVVAPRDPLAVVLALGGVLFASNVAAGPHLFDAGELVAASWELGGSHPPGQPLHALLAHVFARIPLGPIAMRVALFSTASVLVAAALAACIARELGDALKVAPRARAWAGAVTALAVMLAGPVLRQALRPEVYALALALSLGSALCLLRWARHGRARALYGGAFLAGLAAAVHPPHGLSAMLIGLGLGLGCRDRWLGRPRHLIAAAIAAVLGLSVYAYLPLRAAAGASTWGDPTTLAGFVEYVSARAYVQNTFGNVQGSLPRELFDYSFYTLAGGGWLAAVGVGMGLSLSADSRRSPLPWAALGAGLSVLAACMQPLEARNPDNVAYLGPTVALLFACGAAGFAAILPHTRLIGSFGLAVLALSPQNLLRVPGALDSDLPQLDTLSLSLVEAPPPRALVVPTTDHAAASLWMARSVDAARPDLAVFVAGLATSSWHWRSLAAHPAFDGKPVRGNGPNAHAQYLAGAVTQALPQVPVALELDLSPAPPPALAGPYVMLSAGGGPPARSGLLAANAGERLHATLVAQAREGPEGDHGAARAIVRDYELRRGMRLLALGRIVQGIEAIGSSMAPLSESERAALAVTPIETLRPMPPVVQDADSFMVSRGEAARTAAAVLWAAHGGAAAVRLLELQTARGDDRALLQLAWLQLSDGATDGARASLAAFTDRAPQLASEAASLTTALSSTR